MLTIDPWRPDPSQDEMEALANRARALQRSINEPWCEIRLPLIVEFSGSPKSGKTTIIGKVAHFFRRTGFQIAQPVEGASLRTPRDLRDDLLAFNAWSSCYALQHILLDSHSAAPEELVILDRGLFDACVWMEFLASKEGRITDEDRDRICSFLTMDLWRSREAAVFLFTADAKTSLRREGDGALIVEPGRAMNDETLAALFKAGNAVDRRHGDLFRRVFRVDTSMRQSQSPSFQTIAFLIAQGILDIMDSVANPNLLVTEPAHFDGFTVDQAKVQDKVRSILAHPEFRPRAEAEKSKDRQQVVPYALLRNTDGKYFCARRRADNQRQELASRLTILVGGHAERRDWESGEPAGVFERCLRRELEEEIIGIQIQSLRPLGMIDDGRQPVGSSHLAYVYEVETGGRAAFRRQTPDQEFGREPVAWLSPNEISAKVAELDPWSQLVAVELFGAVLPEPHLFVGRRP